MKNIKASLLIVMLMTAGTVAAQYTQDRPNVEYMFKIEAGYLHNVGNYGQPKNEATTTNIEGTGFNLNAWEEGMGLNVINGINISQDFFLGAGVGYTFCAPMRPARPNNYGNTISPYLEVYAGLNWFYDHALQQMDKNYHSLFAEVGVVLVQQTIFIPIRIGWRW